MVIHQAVAGAGSSFQWKGKGNKARGERCPVLSCSVEPNSLWTVARQAPLSVGFPRQEYWSGLPCPPPGDLPNPGIDLTSLPSFWLWRPEGSLHCRRVHYNWATWKLQCIQLSQFITYTLYMAIAFIYKYATIWVLIHSVVSDTEDHICGTMGYRPPGSSVHGIFQGRILK